MMATAVMRPLTAENKLQSKWIDGRPMERVAAEFISPNDRLTSFERLELYNKMYWFRLFDAVREDCPGLVAVLGEGAFVRLSEAYLARHPSRSFTLRNVCSRLDGFIVGNPRLTAPRTALASEVARFEWAQTVAFDGDSLPVVDGSLLARTPPARLRLGIQPYVTLFSLRYPVDSFLGRVKRRNALRSEASNTPDSEETRKAVRRAALPKPSPTFVAVHRLNNRLFHKRLHPAAFRILDALGRGSTLIRAIAAAGPGVKPGQVRAWFKTWMALGWFCAYGNKRRRAASLL